MTCESTCSTAKHCSGVLRTAEATPSCKRAAVTMIGPVVGKYVTGARTSVLRSGMRSSGKSKMRSPRAPLVTGSVKRKYASACAAAVTTTPLVCALTWVMGN